MIVSYHPLSFVFVFLLEVCNCKEVPLNICYRMCLSHICFDPRRTSVSSQLNRSVGNEWEAKHDSFYGYSHSVRSFYIQKKSVFLALYVLSSAQISFSQTICIGIYPLPSSSRLPPMSHTQSKVLVG